MSHLRTFVANQVLSRIRAFLGVFCPDFYSDIEDFTQILCRYLSKISAAGTSVLMSNMSQVQNILLFQGCDKIVLRLHTAGTENPDTPKHI